MPKAKNINPHVFPFDWVDFWIMLALGAVAFLAYFATMPSGIPPGESAWSVAITLRLLPDHAATAPTCLTLAHLLSKVPLFDIPARLNLFSALCGSFAVAFLFRIAKRLIFEFIRDAPSIRFIPVTEGSDAASPHASEASVTVEEKDDTLELTIASAGGVAAALTLAFSSPFWIASNSFHLQPLVLIILLIICDRLAAYHYTGNTGACVIVMLLAGAGLIESPLFLLVAPVAAGLIVYDSTRFEHVSESFFLLLLLVGSVGFGINLLILLYQTNALGSGATCEFREVLSQLAKQHLTQLRVLVFPSKWILILLQTFLPAFLALTSLYIHGPLTNEITRWKWCVINLLLTAGTLAGILNAPLTVWDICRNSSSLPVLSFVMLSVTTGSLTAYWLRILLSARQNKTDDAQDDRSRHGMSMLSALMCMALFVVILCAPYVNRSEADSRYADFPDQLAAIVLKQCDGARCLLTDKTLDLNLLIRAHLAGTGVRLIPTPPSPGKHPKKKTRSPYSLAMVADSRSALQNVYRHINSWLITHPTERKQVASIGNSPVWRNAKLIAVPRGIVMQGEPDKTRLDVNALLTENIEAWERIQRLLPSGKAIRPELAQAKSLIHELISRTANDLAVLFESLDENEKARTVYRIALTHDPGNPIAEMNLLMLDALSSTNSADSVDKINQLAGSENYREHLQDDTDDHGLLSAHSSDELFPIVLSAHPIWSPPPVRLLRLVSIWAKTPSDVQSGFETLAVHKTDDNCGVPRDEKMVQAIATLLQGKSLQAEKLLRLILMENPNSVAAMGVLAEILMKRGELAEVEKRIVPAMRSLTQVTNSVLTEMTVGSLATCLTPPRYGEARQAFNRALELAPDVSLIGDALLRADLRICAKEQLEHDALKILRVLPTHAKANAVMGSLALDKKAYEEAETFLNHSLHKKVSYEALNDLADLHLKRGRYKDAERTCRQAVNLDPLQPLAWGTLGETLYAQRKSSEAAQAAKCAVILQAKTPGPYLLLAAIWLDIGNTDNAQLALTEMRKRVGTLSEAGRAAANALRERILSRGQQNIKTIGHAEQ